MDLQLGFLGPDRRLWEWSVSLESGMMATGIDEELWPWNDSTQSRMAAPGIRYTALRLE